MLNNSNCIKNNSRTGLDGSVKIKLIQKSGCSYSKCADYCVMYPWQQNVKGEKLPD